MSSLELKRSFMKFEQLQGGFMKTQNLFSVYGCLALRICFHATRHYFLANIKHILLNKKSWNKLSSLSS